MTVLRITRPEQAPEFSVDARGYLVALIHDFQIEVPAPRARPRGAWSARPPRSIGSRFRRPRSLCRTRSIRRAGKPRSFAPRSRISTRHQRGGPGDHRRRDQGGPAVALLAARRPGCNRRTHPSSADRVRSRSAQAAGFLDPLDLAARPQRLGPRRLLAATPRRPLPAFSNSTRGAGPAGSRRSARLAAAGVACTPRRWDSMTRWLFAAVVLFCSAVAGSIRSSRTSVGLVTPCGRLFL